MGLHDGHRQRSKRRYLALGAEGMEDHQLLELLLFYAIPRQDTNETATGSSSASARCRGCSTLRRRS